MLTQPLDLRRHHRDGFTCGSATLDDWIKRHARSAQRRGTAAIQVVVDSDYQVRGYYALAMASVGPEDPGAVLRHLPTPAVLIARLAVDQSRQGTGLGSELLIDAIRTSLETAKYVGAAVVTTDAIDEVAASFYRHHGFEPVPGRPLRLFMAMRDARGAFGVD